MDTTDLSFLIPDGSVDSAIDAGFGRHRMFFQKNSTAFLYPIFLVQSIILFCLLTLSTLRYDSANTMLKLFKNLECRNLYYKFQ